MHGFLGQHQKANCFSRWFEIAIAIDSDTSILLASNCLWLVTAASQHHLRVLAFTIIHLRRLHTGYQRALRQQSQPVFRSLQLPLVDWVRTVREPINQSSPLFLHRIGPIYLPSTTFGAVCFAVHQIWLQTAAQGGQHSDFIFPPTNSQAYGIDRPSQIEWHMFLFSKGPVNFVRPPRR